MKPRLFLLLAAVLTLASCNISTHVKVNPDGSGSYTVVLAAPKGASDTSNAIYKALQDAAAKSSVPLTVTRYKSAKDEGAQASLQFKSLKDLEAESAELGKAGGGLADVKVFRDTKGWHFAADSAEGLVKPPGEKKTGTFGGKIDASQLAGMVHISIVVELPGAPGTNNATAVTHTDSSSSFTWDLKVGRVASALQAATTFVGDQASVAPATGLSALGPGVNKHGGSDDDRPWWLYAVLATALLLLAAIAGRWWWNRRGPSRGLHVSGPEIGGPGLAGAAEV